MLGLHGCAGVDEAVSLDVIAGYLCALGLAR